MHAALKSPPPCCTATATTSPAPGTNRGTDEPASGSDEARLQRLFRRGVKDQQLHPLRPLIEIYRQTKAGKARG